MAGPRVFPMTFKEVTELPPEKRWWAISVLVSVLLVLMTRSPFGDLVNAFTDHLHHALATSTFFSVGLEAYRRPLEQTAPLTQWKLGGLFWREFPVAYPPGMFVVFAPAVFVGRVVPMTIPTFAKLEILYLSGIMHGALWIMSALMRQVRSHAWTFVLVVMWIYLARLTLCGFYDGAWLLPGFLGIRAMSRERYDHALLWFSAAFLVSYRGVSLSPLAAYALFGMFFRAPPPRARQLLVVVVGAASVALTLGSFWMLMKYAPKEGHGEGSNLLPMSFRPYVILGLGLLTAAYVSLRASPVVGASVAFASALTIVHAGHMWHGTILVPSLVALTLAKRRTLAVQIVLGLWFVFYLEAAFRYEPIAWFEDMIIFFQHDGLYPR